MRRKAVRWAAFSCPHCPFENPVAVDWMLSVLSDLKPRLRYLFCLGDLFEAHEASRWNEELDHVLKDEYRHGADLFRRLRGACGYPCEYVWILGNHDDNLQTNDARRIPRGLREVVHWNNDRECSPEFLRWQQVPYEKSADACYRLGQVTLTHGFDSGATSDELESLQFQYMLGGLANMLVVRGHTHRPAAPTQCVRTKRVPLNCYYANAGTIGTLKPLYMRRKFSATWGPGLIVGEAVIDFDPLGGIQWEATLLQP